MNNIHLLLSLPLLTSCFFAHAEPPADTEPPPGDTSEDSTSDADTDADADTDTDTDTDTDADADADTDTDADTDLPPIDSDGDGFPAEMDGASLDCDDIDPSIYPGARDTCGDGLDQDCDGVDDHCGWVEDTLITAADATLQGYDKEASGFTGWGRSIQFLGDVDGDGLPDVGLGADQDNSHLAAVMTEKPSGEVDLVADGAYLISAGKDASWDMTGYSIASPGDVNGDGYADVVVGDPEMYNGEMGDGGVLLFLGPITRDLDAKAEYDGALAFDSPLSGSAPWFGWEMEAAGDVDDDGVGDLLVGAPGYNESVGAVALVSGDLAGEHVATREDFIAFLQGDNREGGEGMAGYTGATLDLDVFSAMDHNGDGIRDIWVGSPGYADWTGRGSLFDGPVRGILQLADADLVVTDGQSIVGLGQAVGDVNADGYDDLLHGDPNDRTFGSDSGYVRIFAGPILSLQPEDAWAALYGGPDNENLGVYASSAGDFNGDGRADIVTCDPYSGPGVAYVVTDLMEGTHALADVSFEIRGTEGSEYTASNVTGGRDLDGDGYDDLLVGSPFSVLGGQVFVFYGGEGG